MTRIDSSLDESLYKTILELFTTNGNAAYVNLRLGVSNGFVHLAGVVASLGMRSAAEDLVANIPGVRGVVNRIQAPGAPSPSRIINLDLKK